MKLNFIKFLPVLIVLSIIGQRLACSGTKKNTTSRAKRGLADIGMQVAAIGVDIIQQGAAAKTEWKVKGPGNKN